MFGPIRSQKLYIPLITIFGLALVFVAYSFLYVSRQEAYANERAFRLLSVVGDQLVQHFDNLQRIMAASLVQSPGEDRGSLESGKAARYLKRIAANGSRISVLKETAPCPADWKREGAMRLFLSPHQANFALKARFVALSAGESPCSLETQIDPAAEFRRRFRNLTSNYFDDILIATSSGEVLFASNPSDLRISNLETLVAAQASSGAGKSESDGKGAKAKAGSFAEISQFSNVRDVKFAGGLYKLYVQPMRLLLFADESEKESLKTVICGLWRVDRQQSELVSIPYATLIWGVLGVLAAFGLLWPLLKVAYMSPTERLKRPHVFYLLSSALFVTAVLTTLALNAAYMSRLDGDARRQLDALADRIDRNVRTELARALTLMNRFECADCGARGLLASASHESWTRARILGERGIRDFIHIYPYFDNIFWADRDGRQLFKLSVRGEATPKTSVAEAAYFRAVLDGRGLQSLAAHPPDHPRSATAAPPLFDAPAVRSEFRMQTIYSPNTGEYLVVVAKPARREALPSYFDQAAAQVLVTRLISLQEPALPAGFGFAVVDDAGLVQFHSSEGRNQIENFFKESGGNPLLQAMVAGGTSGFLDVDYSGKQQMMRVQPLPYLGEAGLTLIVFRDTNYFRTINMVCMLTFGFLSALFGLPVLVAVAAHVARGGSYPLAPLWPDHAARQGYLRVILAAACLAGAFAVKYPQMNIDDALRAVLVLFGVAAVAAIAAWRHKRWCDPATAAAVTLGIAIMVGASIALLAAAAYLAVSLGPARRRLAAWSARWTPSALFVAAAFSLLVAEVVLPSFGLFKIAYHSITRLALQTALQDRHQLLVRRSETIRERFANLEAVPGESRERCGEHLDAIVTRRILEGLDRYDRPVFAPRDTKLEQGEPSHASPVERRIASLTALFPNNTFGGQLRQATLSDQSGWKTGVVNGYEVVAMTQIPAGLQNQPLRAVYPIWRVEREHFIVLLLLAGLLIVWLACMVRKLFLTDLAQTSHLEPWAVAEPDSCLLVIGHPKSGRSTAASRIPAKDWIDLAEIVPGGNWTLPELKEKVVVVDNFEFDIENPAHAPAKLKLLEALVFVRKKRVILLSTVDPMFYAEAGAPEAQPAANVLDRWAALLSNFEKFELNDAALHSVEAYAAGQERQGRELPPALVAIVAEECGHSPELRRVGIEILARHAAGAPLTHARILEQLIDRADAFYRVIWAACTNQERLVLFQLARDGWANPKNARAIQQLERRGLVRRTPALRIFNESFCRFVKNAQLSGEIAKWEKEIQTSTWSALKLGFTTAALAGGAWLLYTQQEVFQAGLGYVAAMGTASGAVISLVRSVSQVKIPGSSDKTMNA